MEPVPKDQAASLGSRFFRARVRAFPGCVSGATTPSQAPLAAGPSPLSLDEGGTRSLDPETDLGSRPDSTINCLVSPSMACQPFAFPYSKMPTQQGLIADLIFPPTDGRSRNGPRRATYPGHHASLHLGLPAPGRRCPGGLQPAELPGAGISRSAPLCQTLSKTLPSQCIYLYLIFMFI